MQHSSNESYVQYRHAELLHEAERERLADEARAGRRGIAIARLYRPALVWIGHMLMAAGNRLQEMNPHSQSDRAALL
jgi:hypothetical protein